MANQTLPRSIRRARRRFSYPKLWAAFGGVRIPKTCISGKRTGLSRPEAVAFTPSGDLMAISNTGRHSVSLYTRGAASRKSYATRPCFTISDPESLNYVHDVAFSPCGNKLAIVAREDHSLSIFMMLDKNSSAIEGSLLWYIRGQECGLSFPAGVAIHPSGDYLAVANRMYTGITLYGTSNGQFDSTPIQTITEEALSIYGLASPHGLDFSPDGTSLIVTHKRFYKAEHPKGDSGLSIFKWRTSSEPGINTKPTFIFPYGRSPLHLVAFHPSGKIVAVSNETEGVDVLNWQAAQGQMTKLDTISLFRVGTGAKGVAFTRDGKQIAVTTDLNEVLFFDVVPSSEYTR